ncbi:hypothetical protein CC80DRAFT_574837 [Byssothecium circinans]|uniref:F-box domain-containing protein n=1 Tax=Byssothecium circinans TaxID=147558 RepID=A0A6A5ULS9_9PLEO|nr:hypothetical protein CC80DRAFT_574837 [Byssothecium circinans]
MFVSLPVELQRECVRGLDLESLKAFRLVSKTTLALPTEELFSTVGLMPSDESVERYTNIINDEKLNPLVRKVVFNTSDDPNSTDEEESKLLESYADAMKSLGRFEKLKEVGVRFAQECADSPPWSLFVRTKVLEALFEGTENSKHSAVNVNCLTIKNLQDVTSSSIYESDNFHSFRSRLKQLHLDITTETDDLSPEHSIELDNLHIGFDCDLPLHWLEPLQPQLTDLSIFSNTFWGFYPDCNLQDIHFPNLKSLSLGNWNIVHDWQIDWILSHGTTLRELFLDDCGIVTLLRMTEKQIPEEWSGLPVFLDGGMESHYVKEITMRWHEVFPRFQSDLPQLQRFSLGKGDWDWGTQFEERYELTPRLLETRC